MTERFGQVVLAALLAASFALALSFDRTTWLALVGDESTYLAAAESLAFDGDLRYQTEDLRRFERHWGRLPEGLILQSADRGGTLVYAKPALYPLATALFSRLSPTRGPFVGNAFWLALAAVALAWGLQPALGAAAPWWAAAFLFLSTVPAYVLWAHADLFWLALSTIGLALIWGPGAGPSAIRTGGTGGTGREIWARWAFAGALLAATGASRWWYLGLVLAGFAGIVSQAPDAVRRKRVIAFAAGAAGLLAVQVGSDLVLRGAWSSYGGERMSFSSATGFPATDATEEERADAWKRRIQVEGPGSWVAPERRFPFPITPRLVAWDAVYYLIGGHVGLLVTAPGLLLLFAARGLDRGRWVLLLAFALAVAGFVAMRPFNFYGGGGAIGNRYILPMLPALWFLAGKNRGASTSERNLTLAAPLVALLAAPLLLALWTSPTRFPFPPGAEYPWVSDIARRWLPYETTQSHLKPSGQEDFVHGGLWVKPLGPGIERSTDSERLRLLEDRVDLLLGSQTPIERVCTESATEVTARAHLLRRGRPGEPLVASDPTRWSVPLGMATASHPMWWSRDNWYLYRVRVEANRDAVRGASWIRLQLDCPAPSL